MLWFERQVVAGLMSPDVPASCRPAVEAYVERQLSVMPEHLRLGVAGESLLFGAVPALRAALGAFDPSSLAARLERWKTSRFDPIRQYVRLLESLVLFAE